jgi:serine protease AprX
MTAKYFITFRAPEDARKVRDQGCEIIAEYPDTILIRCTDSQKKTLQRAGLEISELPSATVKVTGASFAFENAVEAERASPVTIDPLRKGYYLVRLAGPPARDWMDYLKEIRADIHGTLSGFTLLVGMMPSEVGKLKKKPWVEEITPYRPSMKVSPSLRSGSRYTMTAAELQAVQPAGGEPSQQEPVKINVFPGESTGSVTASIWQAGGSVANVNGPVIIASISRASIPALAADPGVQSIQPFRLPKLHNDQAETVMDIPANQTYGTLTITGAGQTIGITDSGLDTGDPANLHRDIRGRTLSIVSLPMNAFFRPYTNNVSFDDGAADTDSGHGTHVTGSVLGNGTEAVTAGTAYVPRGTAPDARVFFQAADQQASWKTVAQLTAAGLSPFTPYWPPPAIGLYGLPGDLHDLYTPAYAAGVRIHTNSWGSPDEGEYTTEAHQVDDFLWNHRDMTLLFSAGNEGVDADSNGVIDEGSVGSPGTAKNCVTVGACENNRPHGSTPAPGLDGNWTALVDGSGTHPYSHMAGAGHISDNPEGMAAFSSRGPTDDGRIKPDVTAPGTNVLSVRSSVCAADPLWGDLPAANPLHGLYCWSGGTSMSTPLVAGAAGLIRQYLVHVRGHYLDGVKPSGALIKAFLVHGAEPMAGQFAGEMPAAVPNDVEGFGRVNITQSITPGEGVADALHMILFADEPGYAVTTGQTRSFQVTPVDTALPLKVSLVWTDAPAAAGIGGLVNRLYLQVVRPDGTVVDGDTTSYPTVTNNVQQITIPAAVPAGTYEIRVRGVSVTQNAPSVPAGPDPRQDFALTVSNAMGISLQPVSLAQAIDTTGSMDYFGYIEPAKERATQLADFLRPTDHLSVTEFSHRGGIPDARTPYPLRLLGSFTPDWTDAHAAIGSLTADGLTPIGAGLLEAWNQLNTPAAGATRGIVLLSDGLQNYPPDPFDPLVLPAIPASIPVFTIALGPACSVATLQNIANSRPGGAYYTLYSDEDIYHLHEIYAAIQALSSGAALVGLSSAEAGFKKENTVKVPIEAGVGEATFSLSWDKTETSLEFTVEDPDGRLRNATTPAVMERQGRTYHFVRVTMPEAGLWKLKILNRKYDKPVRFTVSTAVSAPLDLVMDLNSSDKKILRLTVKLKKEGKPVKDADVTAKLILPGTTSEKLMKEYAGALKEITLPDSVDEKGLSEEQRLLTRLAVYATRFKSEKGGIFQRSEVEKILTTKGDGSWTTEVPCSVTGNVNIVVSAKGTVDGMAWQRFASGTYFVAGATIPEKRIIIKEIFVRSKPRWKYILIGARVMDDDGTPATPDEGTVVSMEFVPKSPGGKKKTLKKVPYVKRGYYAWHLPVAVSHREKATVTVLATKAGISVKESKIIELPPVLPEPGKITPRKQKSGEAGIIWPR